MRTSESKGHQQAYDSSAAFGFEVPRRVRSANWRNFKSAALPLDGNGEPVRTFAQNSGGRKNHFPVRYLGEVVRTLRAIGAPIAGGNLATTSTCFAVHLGSPRSVSPGRRELEVSPCLRSFALPLQLRSSCCCPSPPSPPISRSSATISPTRRSSWKPRSRP